MRIGFLDESGRSQHEPVMVVAGIIVHGDRTYRALEDRLREIAAQYIPEPERTGFLFHAKDIFHGAGYFKDKAKWPRDRRDKILTDLAGIPKAFTLPVVFGYAQKTLAQGPLASVLAHTAVHQKHHRNIIDGTLHGVAFAMAEVGIEQQMRDFPRNEICMVIAEDTDRVKQAVKIGHRVLRNPVEIARVFENAMAGILPITKIVDTPHFTKKAESAPLQIADVCAFLICRRFRRQATTQRFFELVAPQLVRAGFAASLFGEQIGNEQLYCGQKT